MRASTICVIDFEGTRASGIREYGVVELRDFEIVGTKTAFVYEHDKNEVLKFFASLRANSVFAAHEASVENALLRNLSPIANFGEKLIEWEPWIDTKKLYMEFFRNAESYDLSCIIKSFCLSEELNDLAEKYCPEGRRKFHSALYDAIASALLLKNLKKTFENNGLNLTIEQLIMFSGQ